MTEHNHDYRPGWTYLGSVDLELAALHNASEEAWRQYYQAADDRYRHQIATGETPADDLTELGKAAEAADAAYHAAYEKKYGKFPDTPEVLVMATSNPEYKRGK